LGCRVLTSRTGRLLPAYRADGGKGEKKSLYGAHGGRALSEEQFREWVNRRSRLPLAVRGHTFVLKDNDVIAVDGGKFVYEEALELVRLLNSRSPFAQINANVMISERNGALRLIVVGLIAVIIVVVILLARR
jgi:hypothetical protein